MRVTIFFSSIPHHLASHAAAPCSGHRYHSQTTIGMRILKARSALLSDFEVLKVLKEMESEQKIRGSVAPQITHIDEDDEDARRNATTSKVEDDDAWLSKVPENLRTIQYEVSDFHRVEEKRRGTSRADHRNDPLPFDATLIARSDHLRAQRSHETLRTPRGRQYCRFSRRTQGSWLLDQRLRSKTRCARPEPFRKAPDRQSCSSKHC